MMGKGHFTKFTLLHAVIIHIPARFLGYSYCFDAAVLGFHNEAAVIIAICAKFVVIPTSHFYFEEIFCIHSYRNTCSLACCQMLHIALVIITM